ncbi:serine/threonine protein kinase [Paenibacillus donghaensis]|uniref:serine/threonine-protein kinase n=1 Tax=Paenibacillus donghaensis TaxID=414771 RepID=UPI001883B6D0|nr:serine/threonine-protein kinase [Paenibacillus donghaensis]MBE9917806.1 serine/threonine protein kinase [Paenibacillus donghaensis]
MITKIIDGVTFELKEEFDFNFLSEYGKVFAVFDKQDSGYLCFGILNGNKKRFVKVAGAATVLSNVSTDMAITRLKSTVSVYQDLSHPSLIEIIEHKEIKNGYLTVFEWFDGDCMGKQYNSFEKFLALPLEKKFSVYNEILLFHIHANKRGYIALDFYDGCIMYDFISEETRICDIEFYAKRPVINTMGRMWGSSRYMSPEEFQLGEEIDERSNVFQMGATAFQLFGGGKERSFDEWQANEKLFTIALKAVSTQKDDRYQSINEYFEAWNNAITGNS